MIAIPLICLAAICAPQSPTKAPAFTLFGRVVDVRGEGIPVANIEIGGRVPGQTVMRTTTDGEGRFRIGGLHRPRTLRLHASAIGFCRTSQPVPYNRNSMEIVLPEAATLRGTVRNKAGNTVANAAVFATGSAAVRRVVAKTTTDEHGQFVLAGVPLCSCSVAAWIPKEGFTMTTLRVAGDTSVELTPATADLTSLSIALTGVVKGDLHKVTLRIASDQLGGQPEHPEPLCVPSMKGATWTVDKLPNWRFLIWPEADGIKFQPSIVTVEAGAGPHRLTFAARKPHAEPMTIRARVRGQDGKGIPSLRMTIYCESAPGVRTMTDSEGAFTTTVPQASGAMASFFVKDERWLLLRTENADSANESVRKPITADQVLELQAVRSCSVTGRLLMFDGKPATYVEVALQRNRGDANRSRWGPVAFATTDGDGKFSCLGLSHTEKHLRLFVMSPAGSAAHPYVHTADVAGTIGLGDITLAQPAVVHGVVRRPDGTPAIGYSVTLREHQPKQKGDGYLRSAMTDSQGRYRFACVPPCSANLVVMDDPGQPLQQHPVTLAPGEIHKLNLDVLGN